MMTSTFVKTASAAVLTGTLLVSSYTPFTAKANTTSVQLKSTDKEDVKVTTQVKTTTATNVYAKYADIKKGKVAHTLPAGTYIKKTDTVELNGKKYYSITYSNAHEITSKKDFDKNFDIFKGYVKVSDTLKEKVTISGYDSLFSSWDDIEEADLNKFVKSYIGNTTRTVVTKNTISNSFSPRFDNFEDAVFFDFTKKGEILIFSDKIKINNKTYYVGITQETLVMIPATSTKKIKTPTKVYTTAERKVSYKVTKDTFTRLSFGKEFLTSDYAMDKVKAGTKVQVLKEVTADGKKYVFIKLKYSKKQLDEGYTPYGWILKDRIKKVK